MVMARRELQWVANGAYREWRRIIRAWPLLERIPSLTNYRATLAGRPLVYVETVDATAPWPQWMRAGLVVAHWTAVAPFFERHGREIAFLAPPSVEAFRRHIEPCRGLHQAIAIATPHTPASVITQLRCRLVRVVPADPPLEGLRVDGLSVVPELPTLEPVAAQLAALVGADAVLDPTAPPDATASSIDLSTIGLRLHECPIANATAFVPLAERLAAARDTIRREIDRTAHYWYDDAFRDLMQQHRAGNAELELYAPLQRYAEALDLQRSALQSALPRSLLAILLEEEPEYRLQQQEAHRVKGFTYQTALLILAMVQWCEAALTWLQLMRGDLAATPEVAT